MKRSVLFALSLMLVAVGTAEAGSPSLLGTWSGQANAILPGGVVLEGIPVTAEVMSQAGTLFAGSYSADIPGIGVVIFDMTGTIGVDKRVQGVVSQAGLGFGALEGRLTGKVMQGVLLDFSDGSTATIVLTKE